MTPMKAMKLIGVIAASGILGLITLIAAGTGQVNSVDVLTMGGLSIMFFIIVSTA